MKIGNLEAYGVIYLVENKINKKVYIGQTTRKNGFDGRYLKRQNPIEGVYEYHLNLKNKKNSFNSHLLSSIEKYGLNSFNVCKIYDVAFSKEELDIKEKLYIEIYKSTDNKYGYNNKEGGSNGKQNKETILKMSGNNHPMYGKKHTEETKNKISNSVKGKYSGSLNPNSKIIICLNNGEIYNTIKEACLSLTIKTQSGISNVLSGKRNSHNGYFFMYASDFYSLNLEEKKKIEEKYRNKIICNNGNKIKCLEDNITFDSLRKASVYYGGDHSVLSRALNKNNRTFCGKHFISLKDGEL